MSTANGKFFVFHQVSDAEISRERTWLIPGGPTAPPVLERAAPPGALCLASVAADDDLLLSLPGLHVHNNLPRDTNMTVGLSVRRQTSLHQRKEAD